MGFGLGLVGLVGLVALVAPGGLVGLGADVSRFRRIGHPGGGCHLGLLVLVALEGLGGRVDCLEGHVGVPGAFFAGLLSHHPGFRMGGLGGLVV